MPVVESRSRRLAPWSECAEVFGRAADPYLSRASISDLSAISPKYRSALSGREFITGINRRSFDTVAGYKVPDISADQVASILTKITKEGIQVAQLDALGVPSHLYNRYMRNSAAGFHIMHHLFLRAQDPEAGEEEILRRITEDLREIHEPSIHPALIFEIVTACNAECFTGAYDCAAINIARSLGLGFTSAKISRHTIMHKLAYDKVLFEYNASYPLITSCPEPQEEQPELGVVNILAEITISVENDAVHYSPVARAEIIVMPETQAQDNMREPTYTNVMVLQYPSFEVPFSRIREAVIMLSREKQNNERDSKGQNAADRETKGKGDQSQTTGEAKGSAGSEDWSLVTEEDVGEIGRNLAIETSAAYQAEGSMTKIMRGVHIIRNAFATAITGNSRPPESSVHQKRKAPERIVCKAISPSKPGSLFAFESLRVTASKDVTENSAPKKLDDGRYVLNGIICHAFAPDVGKTQEEEEAIINWFSKSPSIPAEAQSITISGSSQHNGASTPRGSTLSVEAEGATPHTIVAESPVRAPSGSPDNIDAISSSSGQGSDESEQTAALQFGADSLQYQSDSLLSAEHYATDGSDTFSTADDESPPAAAITVAGAPHRHSSYDSEQPHYSPYHMHGVRWHTYMDLSDEQVRSDTGPFVFYGNAAWNTNPPSRHDKIKARKLAAEMLLFHLSELSVSSAIRRGSESAPSESASSFLRDIARSSITLNGAYFFDTEKRAVLNAALERNHSSADEAQSALYSMMETKGYVASHDTKERTRAFSVLKTMFEHTLQGPDGAKYAMPHPALLEEMISSMHQGGVYSLPIIDLSIVSMWLLEPHLLYNSRKEGLDWRTDTYIHCTNSNRVDVLMLAPMIHWIWGVARASVSYELHFSPENNSILYKNARLCVVLPGEDVTLPPMQMLIDSHMQPETTSIPGTLPSDGIVIVRNLEDLELGVERLLEKLSKPCTLISHRLEHMHGDCMSHPTEREKALEQEWRRRTEECSTTPWNTDAAPVLLPGSVVHMGPSHEGNHPSSQARTTGTDSSESTPWYRRPWELLRRMLRAITSFITRLVHTAARMFTGRRSDPPGPPPPQGEEHETTVRTQDAGPELQGTSTQGQTPPTRCTHAEPGDARDTAGTSATPQAPREGTTPGCSTMPPATAHLPGTILDDPRTPGAASILAGSHKNPGYTPPPGR
ncbi:hypothetical protein [Anaplasma capra]|uniref:hypothetical protein n=1 Tax=Anaplasma capra TaxID=1562740 RepID=UPI0021D5C943|nr:hypothetical protein [Anaplasma capra]MCU7612467.1 hypothetical protein [Anaplasma capra]